MENKIETIEILSNLLRQEIIISSKEPKTRNMYGLSIEEEELIREKLMSLIKQI